MLTVLLAAFVASTGCGPSPTGVELTITYDEPPGWLSLTAYVGDEGEAGEQLGGGVARLPEEERELEPEGESVVILLPESMAGRFIHISVYGFDGDEPSQEGAASVELVQESLVEATVELEPVDDLGAGE